MKKLLPILLSVLLLLGCGTPKVAEETTAPAEAVTYPTETEPTTEATTEPTTVPTEPPFTAMPIPIDEPAPVPDENAFGQETDPAALQWLLDEAAELLDGQETLFSAEKEILEGSVITYYYDRSILVITWKEVINNLVYTISEVKVADASQFRRYLAGNEYNSKELAFPSDLAVAANAVVASAGDYYRGKKIGAVVYQGEVKRVNGKYVDTCFIDENGDMIFSYAGEMTDVASTQEMVDAMRINFSLAFGPVLVDGGVRCEPQSYACGEVNDNYPRAALCQMDSLHYLLVVANKEAGHNTCVDIHEFAEAVAQMGCQKAYTLDGGQTAVIAMQGQPLNKVHLGSQRRISDIIYFATAIR